MKKHSGTARVALMILSTVMMYAAPSYAQPEADVGPTSSKSHVEVYGMHVGDAFKERGGEKDAVLYGFNLFYRPSASEDQKLKKFIYLVAFSLKGVEGLMSSSAGEMRLVSKVGDNSISLEPNDRVVARSTIDLASRKIIFRLKEELRGASESNQFLLVGDFPALKEGTVMEVALDPGLIVVKVEGREEPLSIQVGNNINYLKHREGNDPPALAYVFRSGNLEMRDGVNPAFGRSGDTFTFAVRYSDPNNDPAVRVELWIDLNEDGVLSPEEKIKMEAVGKPSDLSASQEFTKNLQVIPQRNGRILYRFWASDGKSDAEGPPTQVAAFEIPVSTIVGFPTVEPPQIVPGERFRVTYPVRFFYDSVIIQWNSVAENKFGPFELVRVFPKDIQPSKHKYYDEGKLVVELKAPATLPFRAVRIPPLTLRYKWWIIAGLSEDIRESISPAVNLKLTPLRAKLTLLPTRALTTTGDYLEARLTVTKHDSVTLLSDPEKEFNLGPFTGRGSKPVRVTSKYSNGVEETTYSVFLSALLTGSPGAREYAFPPQILRYSLSGKSGAAPVELQVPGSRITLRSLLAEEELGGLFPPMGERRFSSGRLTRSLPFEMHAAWWIAVIFFTVAAAMLLKRPVEIALGAVTLSRKFLTFEAHWKWKTTVRRLGRSRNPDEHAYYFSRLEHVFRRQVACVIGLSAKDAQSVLLWDRVRNTKSLSEDTRSRVIGCLDILVAVAEGRADEDARARLLSLQKELLRELK